MTPANITAWLREHADAAQGRAVAGVMADHHDRDAALFTPAADAIKAAYARGVEDAAGVAEQLGGDRVERGRSYSDDRHGRGDMVINAQRVRAQSIAAAIRQLAIREGRG